MQFYKFAEARERPVASFLNNFLTNNFEVGRRFHIFTLALFL